MWCVNPAVVITRLVDQEGGEAVGICLGIQDTTNRARIGTWVGWPYDNMYRAPISCRSTGSNNDIIWVRSKRRKGCQGTHHCGPVGPKD
jgi:hypothetical protein